MCAEDYVWRGPAPEKSLQPAAPSGIMFPYRAAHNAPGIELNQSQPGATTAPVAAYPPAGPGQANTAGFSQPPGYPGAASSPSASKASTLPFAVSSGYPPYATAADSAPPADTVVQFGEAKSSQYGPPPGYASNPPNTPQYQAHPPRVPLLIISPLRPCTA